jgi:hypothetical protein
MPTERQIAAQLKKEIAAMKREQVTQATEAVLQLLHESHLFGSELWPKGGFKAGGFSGVEKLDTITIGVLIVPEGNYKKVRFNIWGKPVRVLKQRRQLVLIFDQAVVNGVYFYPEYPEHVNDLMCHNHDTYIMDMLDFKFELLK